MYGKLIDGKLIYPPASVVVGSTRFIPPPVSWLNENGYLEIVPAQQPSPVEGKVAECVYTVMPYDVSVDGEDGVPETVTVNKLVQSWTLQDAPEAEPDRIDAIEAVINALMGTEGGDA